MFTLDDRKHVKVAFIYLIVSVFCIAFGWIYEQYSHGVYSEAMIYAFIYPLCGGCLPFTALSLFGKVSVNLWVKCFYHPGIATLTVGSIVEGVLEIYGTTNTLTQVYPIVGWILIGVGVALYIGQCVFTYHWQKNS